MSRRSETELTNLCLIYQGSKILVQEKVGTRYPGGLVFPGGHVEEGESLTESVIREMREETGLLIENPIPCGFKDWIMEDGIRYLVLLYKTDKFTGEFKSSKEGKVFWLDRSQVNEANLIWNMRELLEIFDSDRYSEFFFKIKNGKYRGDLLG